jgi:hypothetical protein
MQPLPHRLGRRRRLYRRRTVRQRRLCSSRLRAVDETMFALRRKRVGAMALRAFLEFSDHRPALEFADQVRGLEFTRAAEFFGQPDRGLVAR